MLLLPDTPVTTAFAAEDRQDFEFDLPPNTFGQIEAEQQGVDVALRLLDAEGNVEIEVDRPTSIRGTERLSVVHHGAQTIRRQLRIASTAVSSGTCRITLRIESPVGPVHHQQQDAERAYARGRLLRATDHLVAASEFAVAAELWQQLQVRDWLAFSLRAQGKALLRANQSGAALVPLEAARGHFEELGTEGEIWLVTIHNDLGEALRKAGDATTAIAHFQQAGQLATQHQDEAGLAAALQNEGQVRELFGEQEQALRLYLDALARAEMQPARREMEIRLRVRAANVYLTLNLADDAAHLLDPIADLESLPPTLRDEVILARARLAEAGNNLRTAAASHRQALDFFSQHGLVAGQLQALNSLGQLYRRFGGYDESVRYLQQAVELAEKAKFPPGIALARANLGRTLGLTGDLEGSIAHFDSALKLAEEQKILQVQASCHFGLAWVQRQQRDLQTALHHIERALGLTEQLRQQHPNRQLRGELQAIKHHYHELHVEVLAELGQPSPPMDDRIRLEAEAVVIAESGPDLPDYSVLAWQASDRAKARLLLDQLQEQHVDLYSDVAPATLARLRDLETEIDELQERRLRTMRPQVPAEQREAIETQLTAVQHQYKMLDAEIRVDSRHYRNLNDPPSLTLQQLRADWLNEDTALVSYQLGENQSHLWYIDDHQFQHARLPPRSELEQKVRRLHDAWSQGATTAGALEADLSTILLGPLARWAPKSRLVISADGPLHALPFAALRAPGGGSNFLIQDYEVVQVPSVTVLAALQPILEQRTTPSQDLFLLADAVYSSSDPRNGNTATKLDIPSERLRGALSDGRVTLPRLPGTRREAEAILALIGDRPAFSALGFTASRTTLDRVQLDDFRILHFATHGLVHNQHPELSGLVLSLWNEQGEAQDGYLYVQRIARLRLRADLVVLSACDTGQGRELRGEGVQSLAHAFLVAGAPRLVVSVWKVDDNATADLMTRFYSGMYQQGLRPAAALRAAQKQLIENGMPVSHWAGFIHLGDWRGKTR